MKEAIILAGGYGTRLKSVVSDIPKPMAPIEGKPFLEMQLEALKKKGFGHIILSLGYKWNVVQEHFGNNYKGLKLSYVVEKTKLDTGGAIRLAMTRMSADYIYILNGDSFLDIDIKSVDAFVNKHGPPVILGYPVKDVRRYGCIEHQDGIITEYFEKGIKGPGIINAGVYIFKKNQLNHFGLNMPFSIEKDYFFTLTKENKFRIFIANGYFIDIGVPEDYERAQAELQKYMS